MNKEFESITSVLNGQEQALHAGRYSLHRFDAGKFWLMNDEGEGMETSEEKVSEMFDAFFKENF